MMKNGNGKNTKKLKLQKIWREEIEMMIQSGNRSTARKINIVSGLKIIFIFEFLSFVDLKSVLNRSRFDQF